MARFLGSGFSTRTVNSNRIHFITRLTPEQCVSRLTAAIDNGFFAGLFGSRPVVGRVTETSLRLGMRRAFDGYPNSFRRWLTARMRREPAGTVISGKVAIHPLFLVFMFFWCGACIWGIFYASGGPEKNALQCGIMLGFGCAAAGFGRYLTRNETRFLKDFLTKTLDAEELK